MAKRFIDADELELEYYDLSIHGTIAVKSVLPIFADLLEKQPTADVAEVRHGEWIPKKHKMYDFIKHKNIMVVDEFRCSVCENSMHNKFRYCPHCGARMDGDEDEL